MQIRSDSPAIINPFLLTYCSPKYFCDRARELDTLKAHMDNARSVVITSPRRIGKSGLIRRLFDEKSIRDAYNCLYVDIFSTSDMQGFANALIRAYIRESEKPMSHLARYGIELLKALKLGINTGLEISWDGIHSPEVSIEQMFDYLNSLKRPTILAIDEFQQIASYRNGSAEALLRTFVQASPNIRMIYSGSEQHLLQGIFGSASRPFFMSATFMELRPINRAVYARFAQDHFTSGSRIIPEEVFNDIYDAVAGKTWFIQRWLNVLYSITPVGACADHDRANEALSAILEADTVYYQNAVYSLSAKQKEFLIILAKEGCVNSVMSSAFLKKHRLTASSVQAICRALAGESFRSVISQERQPDGSFVWKISDTFFSIWLRREFGQPCGRLGI